MLLTFYIHILLVTQIFATNLRKKAKYEPKRENFIFVEYRFENSYLSDNYEIFSIYDFLTQNKKIILIVDDLTKNNNIDASTLFNITNIFTFYFSKFPKKNELFNRNYYDLLRTMCKKSNVNLEINKFYKLNKNCCDEQKNRIIFFTTMAAKMIQKAIKSNDSVNSIPFFIQLRWNDKLINSYNETINLNLYEKKRESPRNLFLLLQKYVNKNNFYTKINIIIHFDLFYIMHSIILQHGLNLNKFITIFNDIFLVEDDNNEIYLNFINENKKIKFSVTYNNDHTMFVNFLSFILYEKEAKALKEDQVIHFFKFIHEKFDNLITNFKNFTLQTISTQIYIQNYNKILVHIQNYDLLFLQKGEKNLLLYKFSSFKFDNIIESIIFEYKEKETPIFVYLL